MSPGHRLASRHGFVVAALEVPGLDSMWSLSRQSVSDSSLLDLHSAFGIVLYNILALSVGKSKYGTC